MSIPAKRKRKKRQSWWQTRSHCICQIEKKKRLLSPLDFLAPSIPIPFFLHSFIPLPQEHTLIHTRQKGAIAQQEHQHQYPRRPYTHKPPTMSYSRQEEDGKDTLHFLEPSPSTTPLTSSTPSDQSAAYDPETGEINWDCPCLGGMAQGPCGDTFKEAFSCFVHSEAEPKGSDCLEKFTAMHDCFRANGYYDGEDEKEDDEEVEEKEESESETKNI